MAHNSSRRDRHPRPPAGRRKGRTAMPPWRETTCQTNGCRRGRTDRGRPAPVRNTAARHCGHGGPVARAAARARGGEARDRPVRRLSPRGARRVPPRLRAQARNHRPWHTKALPDVSRIERGHLSPHTKRPADRHLPAGLSSACGAFGASQSSYPLWQPPIHTLPVPYPDDFHYEPSLEDARKNTVAANAIPPPRHRSMECFGPRNRFWVLAIL